MSIPANTTTADRTTERSRARQRAWISARVDTLLTLRQKFPHAFARLSDCRRRPLKVGIHLDIQAALPDLDPIEISRALRYYVSDIRYHRGCIEGAERIDLDGNAAGTVTAAEAENSKRSVTGIEAKLTQRRERREHANPAPAPTPEKPKHLTLADLKAAVAQRKLSAQGAQS
jgi:sRNA-binding protein